MKKEYLKFYDPKTVRVIIITRVTLTVLYNLSHKESELDIYLDGKIIVIMIQKMKINLFF